MAWNKSFSFVLTTITLCAVLSNGLFADAAAVKKHDSHMEKRNMKPADVIDGGFGSIDPDAGTNVPGVGNDDLDSKGTETTPTPDVDKHDTDTTDTDNEVPTIPLDLDPPPPDTVNHPRKITFDYRTDIDFDLYNTDLPDGGVDIEVGSKEDEEASQWLVVTSSGYEYDGSPDVLREIFSDANFSFSGSLDDMISQFEDPVSDDLSDVGPGFSVHSKRTVFGSDTRIKVYRPYLQRPWSAMGHIEIGCTGTFVGPRHILTAGHCLYDYNRKQWRRYLNFQRAKDCDPDTGTYYRWTKALSVNGWTEYGLTEYDYGMIIVDRVSPYYMRVGYNDDISFGIVNMAGYPGDKWGRCMWRTSCTTANSWTDVLLYQCDTFAGMSGSAVYVYWSKSRKRTIYCVHTNSGQHNNSCTRITRSKFEVLKRWVKDY